MCPSKREMSKRSKYSLNNNNWVRNFELIRSVKNLVHKYTDLLCYCVCVLMHSHIEICYVHGSMLYECVQLVDSVSKFIQLEIRFPVSPRRFSRATHVCINI